MTTLPPNLPDERTAQRLLDLLAQLEKAGPVAAAVAPPSPTVDDAELATLRTQNAALRRKQEAARLRLAALAERLEQLPIPQEEEEAAA